MKIAQPTPELCVPDVQDAQAYYRDTFGFEIAWYDQDGEIGAVNHGECALFLRKSNAPLRGGTFWVFAEDVEDAYAELLRLGAPITVPLATTAWGLRQFTVEDAYNNIFHFHHDV